MIHLQHQVVTQVGMPPVVLVVIVVGMILQVGIQVGMILQVGIQVGMTPVVLSVIAVGILILLQALIAVGILTLTLILLQALIAVGNMKIFSAVISLVCLTLATIGYHYKPEEVDVYTANYVVSLLNFLVWRMT